MKYLFITTLITLSLTGCGQDIDVSDVHIDYVDISVSETGKTVSDLTGRSLEPLYSVTVKVFGFLGMTGCYQHHKTDYLQRNDYAGQPLYRSGDTINIQIFASNATGSGDCSDEVPTHDETILVGFCVPGEYTLHVNNYTEQFRVERDE